MCVFVHVRSFQLTDSKCRIRFSSGAFLMASAPCYGLLFSVGWFIGMLFLFLFLCVCKQQQYNLLCRDSEMEAFQVCKIEGVGVLPWSPLKGYVYTMDSVHGFTKACSCKESSCFMLASSFFIKKYKFKY